VTADESIDLLKGTTRKVYSFLLKARKPLGIREIQKALNLSSPSVAAHHLSRLEQAGLLRRENGEYIINRVLLNYNIRIFHFLIPRYFFYSVFAFAVLLIELIIIKPMTITREYFFATVTTVIFFLVFCYETGRTWLKGDL
jgi:DNA-binding transcriptional ArsR family regulator